MKRYIFLLIILVQGTSCSKSFLDINESPNDPATSTSKLVLPSGIASSAYVMGGWYQLLGGFWAQHWAQSTGASQWTDWEDYSLQSDQYDTRQFGQLYSGVLSDMEYIRKETSKTKDWTYYLVATCIQSYTYQVLADLYDNIPFTEALKGTENFTPKWDNGSLVYDSLIARIDFALSQDFTIKSSSNPLATSSEIGEEDLLFQGDIDSWIQFANTLKLKIYLRQVYARPAIAKPGIEALLTEDNFLLDDAKMTAFASEQDKRNPAYETFVDRLAGNIVASATLLDTLKAIGDPRLTKIFVPSVTGKLMVGLKNGHYKTDAAIFPNIKNLATPNLGPVDPVYFFSKAECNFMLAEANLWYGSDADAKSYYEMGIQASMDKFGATNKPSLYEAGGVYEYPSSGFENKQKTIITQKWIASANSQSLEAFFDQNRTGYPNFLVISPTNVTGGKFPKRLIYPDSERKSNPNTPTQVPIYTKVWWDTKNL
ncbi:MAG: SusD/RagB family nutrient-binding outer membrane lipoprotein [Bacteroidales bacterium]|nr:SusD/RagB family nutrient-binding outer membrane lipoprotein [Bacteroidales bacterium]